MIFKSAMFISDEQVPFETPARQRLPHLITDHDRTRRFLKA
jgi:hypothetical protein